MPYNVNNVRPKSEKSELKAKFQNIRSSITGIIINDV